MRRVGARVLGCVLLSLAMVFAGCTYFGVPVGQDRVAADTLQQEIADYATWKTPEWVEGYTTSAHPLPAYVRYFVNDLGMSDLDNPPDGSIFVKEQFDKDKRLIGLTVMKKIAGYDPPNKDWYWAIADASGQVTNAGKLDTSWTSSCISCHRKGDGGDDLLFVND